MNPTPAQQSSGVERSDFPEGIKGDIHFLRARHPNPPGSESAAMERDQPKEKCMDAPEIPVKRWTCQHSPNGRVHRMTEFEHGEYVRFCDYRTVSEELAEERLAHGNECRQRDGIEHDLRAERDQLRVERDAALEDVRYWRTNAEYSARSVAKPSTEPADTKEKP